MPSPIAHSISGYVLARFLPLEQPRTRERGRWGMQIIYAVFVANAADFDFIPQLITGEMYHRGLTHSLIFALGFSAIAGFITSYIWKRSYKQLFLFTLILYSSHLFLDFLSEGRGIQFFSPFLDSFFKFPITIFPGIHHSRGLWDYSHLLPISFELVYSALLLLGLWYWQKNKTRKRKYKNDMN